MTISGEDLLITGGRVYTADPRQPWAQALLIHGDRIRYIGSEADARAHAGGRVEQLRLPGALVLPGLNDSHIHTDWGGHALRMLNLEGVVSVQELQERLRHYAQTHPDQEWIEGTGLGYEALMQDAAPRLTLDAAVSDRPVYLRALDWHTAWANSQALQRAGITRGADVPLPNEVAVNAEGNATGLLKERLAFILVEDCMPALSASEEEDALVAAMRYLNSMGITSVQNMHGDPALLDRYLRLHEQQRQTVRAQHYLRVRDDTSPAYLPEVAERARRQAGSWNQVAGIKMFIDGVVESKTAMLLDPYGDGSGDLGVPDMDPALHRAFTLQADALGLQVATHAIGDRGVRCTLDAYEAAATANGPGRRHRVEHIELLHAGDLPRFARLGVIASMQPLHCAPTIDPYLTPYTELIGSQRLPASFLWRSLLESGALLAFGSDWPIVTPDVRQGLHVAVTRTNVAGEPPGGYEPQQCVTLAQALDAYTRGAAYAEHQEHEKGVLRAGMLADVTVFSRDLFAHGQEGILGAKIVLTMVGGRVVYRDDTAS
ncbi:MAG TPA: amidohydrolase [Chloroflexota bacterium]|nr:amidohydrolase [Chloroflexota bacterium]